MLARLNFEKSRYVTHGVLLLFSVVACYLTAILEPAFGFSEVLTVGLGYEALLLVVLTLVIGPVNLLWKRRNPVNINLRRDFGIWAGITAIIHVIFSFQIFENGNILNYFWTKEGEGSGPLLNLFGGSNYIGLVATLIMLALLVTSNQLSLRLLKGKRWKFLQRFNYPLIALVVIHTFMYQVLNLRESLFFYAVIAMSVLTVVAQGIGVAVTKARANRRLTSPTAAPLPPIGTILFSPSEEIGEQATLARRRFLVLTGAVIFGGGVAAGSLLKGASSSGTVVAQGPSATATTSPTLPARPNENGNGSNNSNGGNGFNNGANGFNDGNGFNNGDGTNGSGSFNGRGGRNRFGSNGQTPPNQGSGGNFQTPPNQGSGGNSQTAPNQNSGGTSQAPTTAPTQGSSSNSRSLVLASAASVPVGSAIKFTTPDTNEVAFLVHESDGSFKAFSGVCTHRPYNLVFSQSQQALVCNLHRVAFDLANGRPEQGPARTALSTFNVKVDSSGNVVYSM